MRSTLLATNPPRDRSARFSQPHVVGRAAIAVAPAREQTLRHQYEAEIARLGAIDGHCADLPIDLIAVTHNVRQEVQLDEEFLASVRAQGILQPILVSVVAGASKPPVVVCIAGHRRLAAARQVGLGTIKCVSRQLAGESAVVAALSENVNRQALHPLDLADSLLQLELQGTRRQTMQTLFNRDRKTIARLLKMGHWTAATKDVIRRNPRTFTSRTLLALASRRASPREIEQRVHDLARGASKPRQRRRLTGEAAVEALEAYFRATGATAEQRRLVLDALRHLHILAN
jgi:ParB/RepB/Spo0J family partition protein